MISTYAGILTLVGTIFILLIAFLIARNSSPLQPAGEVAPNLYKMRLKVLYFWGIPLLIVLIITLSALPYPDFFKEKPDMVIQVAGKMWAWEIKHEENNMENVENSGSETLVIPPGKLVEFQVTSKDVNHGMGIYDSSGKLLTQTQAMPGYVNKLKYRFNQPGTYHIICMEFCGLYHHGMNSEFIVK